MARRDAPERPLDSEALPRPRAVMLIGASRDPRTPGGAILRNLVRANPSFRVHAVNRHRVDVPGARWTSSVDEAAAPEISPLLADAEGAVAFDVRVVLSEAPPKASVAR